MPSFSQRNNLVQLTEIQFRDELPVNFRIPLYDVLRRYIPSGALLEDAQKVLNPWGVRNVPQYRGAVSISKDEDKPSLIVFKKAILGCEWNHVYDIIEEAFSSLSFYEQEFADWENEEPRALPMQNAINEYFLYAGIGWQMVDGKILARGDEPFESTMRTAKDALFKTRPTAAGRLTTAVESLSKRPTPDTAGAVSDSIAAIECVISDATCAKVGEKVSLGDFIKDERFFPGSLKTAVGGLWGYACNEGARHGKEGVEPNFAGAQFVVAVSAALCTLLNSTHPKNNF